MEVPHSTGYRTQCETWYLQVNSGMRQQEENPMTGEFEELDRIFSALNLLAEKGRTEEIQGPMEDLWRAAEQVGKSSSGSWFGYHANVYYKQLQQPPPGAYFSGEWGNMGTFVPERTTGEWVEYDRNEVEKAINELANNPNMEPARAYGEEAAELFRRQQRNALSIIEILMGNMESRFIAEIREEIDQLSMPTDSQFIQHISPKTIWSQDRRAMSQGIRTPPHVLILAQIHVIRSRIGTIEKLAELTNQCSSHSSRLQLRQRQEETQGTMIFIGHGHSPMWMELKIFLGDRLGLPVDEYSRVSSAGKPTTGRLLEMMETATAAFLLMTGEDETAEGSLRARENVVHEAGLFQGRLGFGKAIVLLEEGCKEFSNITGLGHIPFPKNNIAAAFEEVRKVLEREELIG